jgi:hypothetical protein
MGRKFNRPLVHIHQSLGALGLARPCGASSLGCNASRAYPSSDYFVVLSDAATREAAGCHSPCFGGVCDFLRASTRCRKSSWLTYANSDHIYGSGRNR